MEEWSCGGHEVDLYGLVAMYKATRVDICSLLIPTIFSNKSQQSGCPGLL